MDRELLTMMALQKVDFFGDSIWAGRESDEEILVAVKPIVEGLGLAWNAQFERIKRDEVLAEGIRVTRIPSPGGEQDTICLPLNLIPGFLFGISVERIGAPEIRAKVVVYKRECYAVLYAHFFRPRPEATMDVPLNELNTRLRQIEIGIKLGGKAAGRLLWEVFGMPAIPGISGPAAPIRTGALQGIDFVKQFLAERTAEAPGGRVQARELSTAYAHWAAESGAPSMTERAMAMCLSALGINKSRGSFVHYIGLRLLHISEFASEIER